MHESQVSNKRSQTRTGVSIRVSTRAHVLRLNLVELFMPVLCTACSVDVCGTYIAVCSRESPTELPSESVAAASMNIMLLSFISLSSSPKALRSDRDL